LFKFLVGKNRVKWVEITLYPANVHEAAGEQARRRPSFPVSRDAGIAIVSDDLRSALFQLLIITKESGPNIENLVYLHGKRTTIIVSSKY
jgi:hypothetical protein